MGKVINTAILKSDGPPNKMESDRLSTPRQARGFDLECGDGADQLNQMVQRFPTPRLQTDDGDEEMAEMQFREDLLLNYYSLVDRPSGEVATHRPRDATGG